MNAQQQKLAERAMTQDYWLQVMTVSQRFEVMQNVPYVKNQAKRHAQLMDYVWQTQREVVLSHARKLQAEINR